MSPRNAAQTAHGQGVCGERGSAANAKKRYLQKYVIFHLITAVVASLQHEKMPRNSITQFVITQIQYTHV